MSAPRRAAAALLLACAASVAGAGPPAADDVRARDLRDKRQLRFLVFGDSGTGDAAQREVARYMARECSRRGGCDFALMLGDNIYGRGVRAPRDKRGAVVIDERFSTRFEQPYAPLGALEFWLVAGNHDWHGADSVEAQIAYTRYSSRWRMPAHDYAVPLLPDWIRIYGLDTTPLLGGRDPQQVERARAWLCDGTGWRILFGHHPVYSSGWHANTRGEYRKAGEPLIEPLIEACGVQFYLSGHDHQQEHLTAPRFEQIVQGAAARLRRLQHIDDRPPGVEQLAGASERGFALFEVDAERAEVRFFGYGKKQSFRNWHCRAYELADFADPQRRSRSCALDPPPSDE